MPENRESEMWEWAFRLAASGRFLDHAAVETELRARGFAHVNKIADSKYAREQIDAICRNAREAKGKPS